MCKMKFGGILIAFVLLAYSCKQKNADAKLEKFTNNTTKIVVDESLQPIVDEELYIFKAEYQDAKPQVVYAPENTAVNMLLDDSLRVLVLSRELNEQENKVLAERKLKPIVYTFAKDAITLIVNKASVDTNITVSEIKKMLNGQAKTDKSIVFDNPNSGLVRYLKDLSGDKVLKQKNIYALKSNKEVIRYVSTHPDAIGITGFSWLNDPDKEYADAVDNVKIVGVKDDSGKSKFDGYYTPSQTTMALKQYPLMRNLYILNCTGAFGLGMKFADFLTQERGQVIVLKSGLLPENMPGRLINIQSKIKTK